MVVELLFEYAQSLPNEDYLVQKLVDRDFL